MALVQNPNMPPFAVEELRAALARSTASYVRYAASVTAGTWSLDYLDVVIDVAPLGWREEVWEYRESRFAAVEVASEQIVDWLDDHDNTRRMTVRGQELERAPFHVSGNKQRRTGRLAARDPDLPWPHEEYQISRQQAVNLSYVGDLLVGSPPSPTFINSDMAWGAFFDRRYELGMRRHSGNELMRLRWPDQRAYFSRLRLKATHLEILVRGDQTLRARLELNGDGVRLERVVPQRGRVRLPLAQGLPPDALLVLSKDGEWLDYRSLTHRFGTMTDSDMEFVQQEDPASELEGYLYRGEDPTLEFKREIPVKNESRLKVARTVAAFANGNGGTIVFGIDRDEMTLVGCSVDNALSIRDDLQRVFTSRVTPAPSLSVRVLNHEQKSFVVLDVYQGASPPYGANPQAPIYYVRRGANTVHADPDEIRQATQRSIPQDSRHRLY